MSEKQGREPQTGGPTIDYRDLMPGGQSEQAESNVELAGVLALLGQQVDRLQAESPAIVGTGKFPEWWAREVVSTPALLQMLRQPGVDPQQVSQYFDLCLRRQRVYTAITGRQSDIDQFTDFTNDLGAELVGRGFRSEGPDGPMHALMLQQLHDYSETGQSMVSELAVLCEAYELETVTDLLGVGNAGSDEYGRALRPLLRTEYAYKWMRSTDCDPASEAGPRAENRRWMRRALSAAEGMTEEEADAYVFAASQMLQDEEKSIHDIIARFDTLGVDYLRAVGNISRIRAFEDYSDEQLKLMYELGTDPQGTAERLAQHDVNVVFINRVGDTGTLKDIADTFEDGRGRTLFFEIENLANIYHDMMDLRDMGVRPSSVVLAAHSAPGQFMVTDLRDPGERRRDIASVHGRALVKHVNEGDELAPGDRGFSLHGMTGMARLLGEVMQPSRGIDDAKEDTGRIKVLFAACHASSEVERKDWDVDKDTLTTLGLDSVASRLGQEIVDQGVQRNVDIYGAPVGILLHKSNRGVRYTRANRKFDDFDEARQPQHAIRIRVENGRLSRDNVDEVALHKAA